MERVVPHRKRTCSDKVLYSMESVEKGKAALIASIESDAQAETERIIKEPTVKMVILFSIKISQLAQCIPLI